MPAASRTLAVSLAAATLLGGCKYSAALGKREWVVIFKPGATQDQHKLVLAGCSNIPHVDPEPMGTGQLVSELASNVRFRIDKASDADLARLSTCIGQPAFASFVKSYDPTDFGH
ncbi:MAG: hypothetical protein QOI76_43 [Frankiales bacterium]|nr:hypothetical protein [Frankiales bacterium]